MSSIAAASDKKGWKSFVAGAGAGACEILATMPLDVIKTTMQLNAKGSNNPFVVAADIVKSNGVRGLYYGLPAFLTQTSMKAAIRFTAYETCKTLLVETMGLSGTAVSTNLLSGLVAGAAEASVWTTPTERLKVLRQSEVKSKTPRYTTLLGALRTILTEQGIAGLYKGITPTALRQASSVGVRFMLYEPTKSLYMKLTGQDKPNTFITMMSGGTVGGLSVILNNPIDVVKSKIQSQSKSDLPPKYTSTMQCFRSVLAEDGMRGFAAGLLPRVVRVFCGQAVTFVVYEHIVQLVNQMFPN